MGITAAETGFSVSFGQLPGAFVADRGFAGVESLHEIKTFEDGFLFAEAAVVGQAQETFPAGMSRPQDAAVPVDDINQYIDRHTPQLNQWYFDTGGKDDKNMACVDGIVFNSFEHDKIRGHFVPVVFPVAVSVVGIVVGYEHALDPVFLQHGNITGYGYFSVQRALFGVTVHIHFHNISIGCSLSLFVTVLYTPLL